MIAELLMVASGALPDPIAPAATGQVQCYTPDVARKTCQSMAAYRRDAQGQIINDATVLLSPNPVIVMQSSDVVVVRDGRVCGTMAAGTLASAQYLINGRMADAQQSAALKTQIAAAFAPMLGKEVCTAYRVAGDAFQAEPTVSGAAPPPSQRVIWVTPGSGWTVAP